jgi:very-short-patch-repair endonuclease
MNSIIETNPEVSKQWHPTKNGDLKPENYTFGSGQKVWWLCEKTCIEGCLHEWNANIVSRCGNIKAGCPYCSITPKLLCHHLSIKTTHPDISKQWHPTKNGELKPEMFSFGSGKKVWWLCEKKCPEGCIHEWETSIGHRTTNERNCPYCSINPKLLCRHLSITYTHPDISKQWHPIKNKDLKPEMFSFGSGQKVWWLCEKKCIEGCIHEWNAPILERSQGRGCPYCCKPRKKSCSHTSIIDTHPDITKQWHPTKNGELKPENFTYGVEQKVWWLCEKTCLEGCPHEWNASILSRCGTMKSGCPFCCDSQQKFCIHDSLLITHPDIAKQWHTTKNGELKPENFTYGSGGKIWWICKKEHIWESTILHRIQGRGCPCCKNKTEEKLKLYLDKNYLNNISQFKTDWCLYSKTNNYFRFDFLLENFNLIIELDGDQHFRQVSNWTSPEIIKEKDIYKMKKALENSYSVIRIKQRDVWDNDNLWLDDNFLPYIKRYEIPTVLYINDDEDKIYENHKVLMLN